MKAKFNAEEVKALVTKLPRNAEISIVGDHGVYLMSFAQDAGSRDIVYAVGCHPEKNRDTWYDKKESMWGGDDGEDCIGLAGELADLFITEEGREVKEFWVNITSSRLQAGLTTTLNKEAKEAKHQAWVNESKAKIKALTDEKLAGTRNFFYQKRNLAKTAKERNGYITLITMIEDEIRTRPSLKGWMPAKAGC